MIKTKIITLLKKRGFQYRKWTTGKILDKEYKIIKGSVRAKADKDDAWLFALSAKSKTIFDAGCNIGQASLMMLYNENIQRIILIDPNPEALGMAAENLIQNNLSPKASFVSAFVSDKSDSAVEFYTQDSGAAGSIYKSFARTAAKTDSHYTVKTLTLDYISDYFNIIPDLVKVDVEGAERQVLAGAVQIASKGKTIFFVEVHSGPELSITENTNDILTWCISNNYKAWYLKGKKPLITDDIKSRGRFHILLVPASMDVPDYVTTINEGDPLKA